MEKLFQADGDQVLRWANENQKLATYPIKVVMWAFAYDSASVPLTENGW